MAITKFSTGTAAPAGESKGGNTLLYVAIIGVAAWLGYKFWWLPSQEKKKQENAATH